MPVLDSWNCGSATTTATVEMKDGELEALTTPIHMDDLYKTNNVLSTQLWTVAHFLEHLHSVHSHNVLDRRLANALFKNNVVRWVDLLGSPKVIWGSEQDFFDKNIKPLRNELQG